MAQKQNKAKKPKLAQQKWSLYMPECARKPIIGLWALGENNALQFSGN